MATHHSAVVCPGTSSGTSSGPAPVRRAPRGLPRIALIALTALLGLLGLLGATGCEKPDDVPRLQEEALAVAKAYQARFDRLAERAEAIRERGATLPPDVLGASKAGPSFRSALSRIGEYRGKLQQVPAAAKTAAGSGRAALMKLIDELREGFEHGAIETTSELSAVEGAVHAAEQQPARPGAPPADRAPDAGAPGAAPIR